MNTEKALADNQNWKEKYLETYISPDLDMAIIEGIQLMLEAIDSEIVEPLAANKPTQVEEVANEIFKWINSDDVFITDGPGGPILENAYLDCKKNSLRKRLESLPAAPIKPKEK